MLGRIVGEHISVRTELDPALRPILVDPDQMEQVLLNLAVNARDAMPHGGKLSIQTKHDENRESVRPPSAGTPDQNWAVLSISDTGCGIPQRDIPRILEPFFTTKETSKGTGLGLAVVRGIIAQHGGEIRVESEVGRGTTFQIRFPAAVMAGVPKEERARPPLERGRETLLVVEDEPGVLRLIDKILKQLGYTVFCAASADEAVELLNGTARPVDLILTDVVLPGMPVSRFIDYLRAHEPGVKLALMTGHLEEATFLPDFGADGTVLLRKPFTPAALATTIRQVLD